MENQFDQKLYKGVKDIKNIRLTPSERDQILHKIFASPVQPPVKSPYAKHWVVILLPSLLIILLSGGAVFASSSSLPGNMLYPLKTKVIEPLHSNFIFSQGAKASYQSGLATKRLEEAEALADEGELDELNEDKLNALLLGHTDALDKALEKMQDKKSEKKNENKKEEDKIVKDFETKMNNHASKLEDIKVRRGEDGHNEKNKISNTARESAVKIINKVRSEDESEDLNSVLE
jgi:hypothetical protein